MGAVTAVELSKRYDKPAVDRLTFEVLEGQVTGFLGRNGAGKTTTLRMLLGLVAPSAGRATVFGSPYASLREPTRTVGAVLEGSGAHPGRTARDHLRVVAVAAGLPRERVDVVLDLVGLGEVGDRRVREFSLGMRQRLSMATALLGDPPLLVLDEPANGLDPMGVRWLRDLLRAMAAEGRAVLLSSHLLAEVDQIVDRVVVIEKGRLVADGPLADVTAAASTAEVRATSPRPRSLMAALRRAGIAAERTEARGVVARGTTAAAVGEVAAREGIVLHDLSEARNTLEDAFMRLIDGDGETE